MDTTELATIAFCAGANDMRRPKPIPLRDRCLHGLAVTALFVLGACGGGGSSSTPEPPPTPPAATNNRPAVAAIDNQTVAVGGVLNIAVAVSDADASDQHTLAVSTSNACVAASETSGATVTITGLVAGTVEVTVTASDGTGSGNAESAAVTFDVTVEPPTPPTWGLARVAPADSDVEPCTVAGVLDHVFTDRAVQSVLLLADGEVIGERYAEGYDVGSRGTSWSVAKSFYSAAIGVAIDRGAITSLDQRASDLLTEWLGTDKEDITVRDLLAMRAGLSGSANIFVEADQTAFALGQEPGPQRGSFEYSNATSQLFEPLILRATAMNAHDWLATTILEPIGIERSAIGMWFDPTGTHPLTYCCLDMRPDDFARFGVLVANDGVWDGEVLISADYIHESLAAQSAFYGLQWWVLNTTYFEGDAPPIAVGAAHGLEGQHIYVWRDGAVVLVVLTKYDHVPSQGYVLSLANYPSTCAARNSCLYSQGDPVPSYDERELVDRLAELR